MVSGDSGTEWVFVEFVSKHMYTVACPGNAVEGMMMSELITVMI